MSMMALGVGTTCLWQPWKESESVSVLDHLKKGPLSSRA